MSDLDIRNFNLNLLPALAALLEERSVTRAAQRMGVSQSAMSHSLAKLRAQLEDPLLVGQGGALAPTPQAERIVAQLSTSLEGLRELLSTPAPFEPATAERELRIASFDYFEMVVLPDLLAYLRENAPGIRVRVERLDEQTQRRLVRGEIDLCFAGSKLTGGGLKRKKLFDDPFLVIARAEHPGIGARLTLARYAALGHVLVSVEGRSEGVVDRALRAGGRSRTVVARVPHFMSAPLAVMRSDLICTLPGTVARRAAALFGVCVHRPPLTLPSPAVTAYWPERLEADPAHVYLRELLTSGRLFSSAAAPGR